MSLRFCKIHPQMSYMFFATVAKKKKAYRIHVHGSDWNSELCVCVCHWPRERCHQCHDRSYGIKYSMISSSESPAYSCLLLSFSIQCFLFTLKLYISSLCTTNQFLFAWSFPSVYDLSQGKILLFKRFV